MIMVILIVKRDIKYIIYETMTITNGEPVSKMTRRQ